MRLMSYGNLEALLRRRAVLDSALAPAVRVTRIVALAKGYTAEVR